MNEHGRVGWIEGFVAGILVAALAQILLHDVEADGWVQALKEWQTLLKKLRSDFERLLPF